MRYVLVAVIAAGILSGCNVYNAPTGCPTATPQVSEKPMTDSNGRTVININAAQQPSAPAPMMMQTGYQTVYTTEYGPMGPMVKKALIPVYSTAPMPQPAVLMPVPSPMGTPCAPIVMSSKGNNTLLINNPQNFPPAQPVYPAMNEPNAWYGPASSPNNYASTQTNWF